jgi:hypothetical protein
VGFGPAHPPFESPDVDDVPIKNQFVGMGVFEKVVNLLDFAIECAEMNIGNDDGAEA